MPFCVRYAMRNFAQSTGVNVMKSYNWIKPGLGNSGGWQGRHMSAIYTPTAIERPIVDGLKAWIDYAKQHEERHGSIVGDDGFLGDHWVAWGLALRGLLNGECGRLDCGTIDSIIYDNLTEQGWRE